MDKTAPNQRANEPWGDLLQEKPPGQLRIYAMNVNGLSLDRRGGQFDTACAVQKEVQADVLCGQEHNLDSYKTQVRSILYATCCQHCCDRPHPDNQQDAFVLGEATHVTHKAQTC